jgi:hypothetical protein
MRTFRTNNNQAKFEFGAFERDFMNSYRCWPLLPAIGFKIRALNSVNIREEYKGRFNGERTASVV